jgi:hypothetical protein
LAFTFGAATGFAFTGADLALALGFAARAAFALAFDFALAGFGTALFAFDFALAGAAFAAAPAFPLASDFAPAFLVAIARLTSPGVRDTTTNARAPSSPA